MTEKLHVIDGVTYREVERKAKVGEKIIIVTSPRIPAGFVSEVKSYDPAHDDGSLYMTGWVSDYVENYLDGWEDEYRVLEPVRTCDTCGEGLGEVCCTNEDGGNYCSTMCARLSPQSTDDIIANLVRRVAQLETQLDDALKNVQTFGEQTEANSADIRLLDERTQPLVTLSALFNGGERQ